ncbi:MAG TPA: helix-turn-helix domain-containing protein [Baekduia sp.]|nr:helix-turn-helix domain-containing protein [Baekduia sp.]
MKASEEVRALAETWSTQVPALAQEMYDALAARIPVVQSDPELAALTLGSCSSNIEAILSMLLSGIPASATEAPVTALEHARAMAKRGTEVNDTLRFYRLGHGYFLSRLADELSATVGDPEKRLQAVREATDFTVEYIDIVSGRVSAEHLAERERRQRRAAVLRADLVRSLLEADPEDVPGAERLLGHRLDRAQLSFVCWSAAPSAQLERAAVAVAEALGSARPLLVPDGPDAVAAWIRPGARTPPPKEAAAAALRPVGTEVRVALGTVGVGLAGFRTSREEAERARRVAHLAGPEPQVVAFDDVALLDLLARDLPAARRFVHRQLGELADADPAIASIRDTVRAVLAPRGGVAHAAREQDLHRNTVLQRLRRAEALRGRPLDDQPDELYAALVLARALGGATLA